MKRYLASLLLILLVLTSVLPTYAVSDSSADERPMMIFTNLTYEDQPIGESKPYGMVSYGGAQDGKVQADIQAVTGTGNDSERAVCIREPKKTTYWFLDHFLAYAGMNKINHNGEYVISMKLKSPDANSTRRITVLYDAKDQDATDYIDRVNTGFDLVTISGSIKVLNTMMVEEPDPNTWYEIAVAMNLHTQKADLYLNGSKKFTVNLPVDVSNIAFLQFHVPNVLEEVATSCYYYDDLKIYSAPAPVSDEKFAEEWAKYTQTEWYRNEEYSAARLSRYDKFLLQSLWNRELLSEEGLRMYKDNKFYTFPVHVEKVEGTYMVPLKVFAEAYGATVTWNGADNSILVQKGSDTLQCAIGSDIFYINGKISKSRYPIVSKEGNACAPLNVLSIFFDFEPYIQDKFVCLDGKPITIEFAYDDLMGGKNANDDTFEEAMLWNLGMTLLYARPNTQNVIDTYNANKAKIGRPWLIVEPGTFDRIKEDMKTDEVLAGKVNRYLATADGYLDTEPVTYTKTDGVRGSFPQTVYNRGLGLSFAFLMTGDPVYKDRLWEELEALSKFPDFNPGHFLDVGNTGNGVTVAYNWLYEEWAKEPEKLAVIEEMMLNNVLKPIITGLKSPYYGESGAAFITSGANQNVIINNAGIGAAISLMDKYPELCSNYISMVLRSLEWPFSNFAPDGGYPEGTSYWNYVMMTLPYVVESLQNGVGSDFGLGSAPGLDRTAYFPIMVAGNVGTFNYGDSSQTGSYDSSHQWFASEFNDESLAVLRSNNMGSFDLKDILYHIPNVDKDAPITLDKDVMYQMMNTATFRTGWTNSDIVACLHGGAVDEPHGHEDNGTFMLDALGERWICELPKEDYNLTQYGSYVYEPGMEYQWEFMSKFLRGKAEGHNTVVVNLGNNVGYNGDMVPTAKSEIVRYDSQDAGGYAICDMTETNAVLECAFRGVKLDRAMQEVHLQDNFRAAEPSDFHWFVNTQADVTLSEDGRSAILSKGSKRMWAGIISDDPELKFETYDAVPLPLYTAPPIQTPNDGYRRLMIHKADSTEFKVTVAFKQLVGDETMPSIMPVDSPMETWKFEEGSAGIATLSDLKIDGETIQGFNAIVNNYTINLPTEKSPIPTVTATTDSNCLVEVYPATELPGVTSIILKDENGTQKGFYNVTFNPINDSTKFLNDKQIPIMAFEASSEPQPENGAVNLFDASFGTKYATDEKGGAITLDLGEAYDVAEIKMAFQVGASRKEFFTIEYSNDNINWIMIDDNGESSGTTTDYQSFTFDPVNARYIRVRFYGNTNRGSGWVSVSELCVFRK